MRTAKSMPVPPHSRGTVIHGTSMSSPFTALKPPIAPCVCQVCALITRPRMPSGASVWTMPWLKVMKADVLAPTAAAASTPTGRLGARRRPQQDGRQPAEDAHAEEELAPARLIPHAGERQVAQDRAGAEADHQI